MAKKPPAEHKPTFLEQLRIKLGLSDSSKAEKTRLEAFLAAYPGEYCGWCNNETVAYSPAFCDMLGITHVETLTDIQSKLSPSDAAALEGLFERLEQNAIAFTTHVKKHDGKKIFKVTGSQGRDTTETQSYNILWFEDVTESQTAREAYEQDAELKAEQLKQIDTAFQALPRPRWMRDKNGDLVWVNEAYSDALGLTISTILNEQKELPTTIKIPRNEKGKKTAKDKPLLGREMAAEVLKTGETKRIDAHISIGGKRLLMSITEIALPDLNMTLGVAEDITREEELETELKRYKSSNIELLEQLRAAIAIYNADENLEFYNHAFAQLWGLEDGWLNTRPKLGDLMEKLRETRRLPEQADFRKFKQSWLDMFTDLINPHDEMLYLPDGSALRMLVIPHSMGGLIMTFEDVTSRLELESSYNTLIAVQRETLDNLGEAVAVFGGDGRLKLCNPAFGRLWNLNPEDLSGEPHISKIVEKVSGFFTKDEWEDRKEEMTAKALDRMMHEGRLKRIDNTLVDFTTVPLPDGGVLITYIDVTDTVRVENALREKNAALEAAEKLKLDFLANVSYQLRTPLNAIMGFNEILDQEYFGPLNQRQKEYTRDTRKASERLLELVNDILDLATLEAGYLTLQREDVSVHALMNNIKDLVSDWARKADIVVEMKCAKNIGKITADEKRLKQAMVNVVRNAITFTPPKGKIMLEAKKRKEGIEFIVTDTGIGIREEDKMRVFEPFERAQGGLRDSRTSRSGAGLGLSLVKNIISLHGGNVDLDSEAGEGTTVTMFIPFTSIETPFKIPMQSKNLQDAG